MFETGYDFMTVQMGDLSYTFQSPIFKRSNTSFTDAGPNFKQTSVGGCTAGLIFFLFSSVPKILSLPGPSSLESLNLPLNVNSMGISQFYFCLS